jgi:hypothetical protein
MLNFNQSKKGLAIVGCTLAGLLSINSAYATNPEPVDVEVEFVAPISITETNALQFGLLDVTMASGDTIIVPTAGAATDSGGNIVGGSQAAANLLVGATATQPITIAVGPIAANTGYALGGFTCNYNGGADTACAGAGYPETSAGSATLLIGATLTGDGAAVAGVQNGSFDVTISYQ